MAFGGIVFSGSAMPDIESGDAANPGTLIAELIDTTRVEVTAKLAEADRANVTPGQAVEIRVDASPDIRLTGTVRAVSGVASRQMFEGGGDAASSTSRSTSTASHDAGAAGCQRRAGDRRARRSRTWCTCRAPRSSTSPASRPSTCERRRASSRARSRSSRVTDSAAIIEGHRRAGRSRARQSRTRADPAAPPRRRNRAMPAAAAARRCR